MAPSGLALLEGEARFHRERLALYRARRYGSRLSSGSRLRELERSSMRADIRLLRARADIAAARPQKG